MHVVQIRRAISADWEVLVRNNCRLADETEGKRLDPARIVPGVQAVLADERKGRYFVACREQRIVGQLMHTWEWSDWRNGEIWWLQSVYVEPEFRRQGVFRALYSHLVELSRDNPDVVGCRLYVETANRPAQDTYSAVGMRPGGYLVMEQMFTEHSVREETA